MNLGDKIKKRCQWTEVVSNQGSRGGNTKTHEYAEGTVVYIHPKGRFYTLEFTFQAGTFRESFSC